jgi:hypothetical protein
MEKKFRRLVIVQGRGTPVEKRIVTDIKLYWVASISKWCSIPER